MSNRQLMLLRETVAGLDEYQFKEGTVSDSDIESIPLGMSRLTPSGLAIGIRKDAISCFVSLVDDILTYDSEIRHGTTYENIKEIIFEILIKEFYDKRRSEINLQDLHNILEYIKEWFLSERSSYELYIPCSISPYSAASFYIGPVKFVAFSAFSKGELSGMEEQFNHIFGDTLVRWENAGANWVAIVTVEKVVQKRAWELGELAVDIALASLQLVTPLSAMQHVARINSRFLSGFRELISNSPKGFSTESTALQAGRSLGPGGLEGYIAKGKLILDAAGKRISGFISSENKVPKLEGAWVDAAYWFSEGVAELLDTVAVTKLETAIEILLCAQSSKGSETRILSALKGFYGLNDNDLISNKSSVTVKQFAKGLVSSRSRILHGTLSTLKHHARADRNSLTELGHAMLLSFVVKLDQYSSLANPVDSQDEFINWVSNGEKI